MLNNFINLSDTEEAHISLTAFYTAIICKNVDWVTSHSRENIILGALLHDIGKIKLSKKIRKKPVEQLSDLELNEHRKHPEYGMDMLDEVDGISEQVKQIVYQHHELNTGEGFPNQLTAKKIYPLAKIVSFANCMSNMSIKKQLSPMDTIKNLVNEKDDIMLYEPFVVRAFIKGFISNV
jgi:putative nucleotidyltransferase with HDIG domain